jgi:hypothetical protein
MTKVEAVNEGRVLARAELLFSPLKRPYGLGVEMHECTLSNNVNPNTRFGSYSKFSSKRDSFSPVGWLFHKKAITLNCD